MKFCLDMQFEFLNYTFFHKYKNLISCKLKIAPIFYEILPDKQKFITNVQCTQSQSHSLKKKHLLIEF